MKNLYHLIVLALLLIALYQPWSYNYHGFDELTIDIAGGKINFELVDQVRSKSNNSYCLSSTFTSNDKSGEPVTISIDKIGTKSNPELRKNITNSGKTLPISGSGDFQSFFEPPGISKLVFPADEPLDVTGSIFYSGVNHRFEIALKLKYWEKSRSVIKFCV